MSTRPSGLVIAGAAIGSTVASVDRPVAELLDQGGGQPQRRGGGRHQLAQGDPLGLVGQPLERTRHEDVPHLLPAGGGVGGGALALSTLAHGVTA